MPPAPTRYLTFRAAGRLQALPADAVREVVALPRTTRVPHAPATMIGLANVRGSALPILSVAVHQGKPQGAGGRVLVLDRAQPVGLLVGDVQAVVDKRGRARSLDVEALIAGALRQTPPRPAAKARALPAPGRREEAAGDTLDLLSFAAGGQEFALPLEQVIAVIATPAAITPLPGADRAVLGTVAHRGALLPVLRLAVLLGLASDEAAIPPRIVIATLRGHRIGLAVDAMRSVLRIGEADIDPVPAVIARRPAEARIQAIARIEGGRRLVSILAADHLVDDSLAAGLGDGRETAAEGNGDAAESGEPVLIFRLGAQRFGLPATTADEVVRVPDALIRLPRTPAFVAGVMNLRGRPIPVIDQRRRFADAAPFTPCRHAIVVRMGAVQAAFAVDAAEAIRRIPRAMVAPAPDLKDDTRLFDRTAMLADGEIALLIEPGELLDGTERALLAGLSVDGAAARP